MDTMPKKPKHRLSTWMISDELYTWIRENLEPGKRILELGSGLGSVALSMDYEVTSLEHDSRYIDIGLLVKYFHVQIADNWYDRSDVYALTEGAEAVEECYDYDLLLVDGPPNDLRLGILNNFDLFRTDRPVIFDDTQRPEVLKVAQEIADKYGFNLINIRSKGQDKNFAILQPDPNLTNNGATSSA